MGQIAAVALLMALAAARALGQECGVPDASHPPSVRIQNGKITGLSQGIHGGQEAVEHSWPWVASLGNCGATLLNKQWLVTAAHCIADNTGRPFAATKGVALGTHYRAPNHQRAFIDTTIYVHPQYKGACGGGGYDIALLKLPFPVKFTDKVKPVCLPSASDDFQTEGEKIITAGWGDTLPSGSAPSRLRQALFLTSLADCERTYIARGHINTENEFCAWGGRGSTVTVCSGDSGSGQFAYRDGKYRIAGVASCGACASPHNPGIFTHVVSHLDWINGHIRNVDAGEGKDVNAPPTCVDRQSFCALDKYKATCDTDSYTKRQCPRLCGVCTRDW